jgi:hypothetical protein
MLPIAMLATNDPDLPGKPPGQEESDTWVCIDCDERVRPEWPDDHKDPRCPKDPSHTLIR